MVLFKFKIDHPLKYDYHPFLLIGLILLMKLILMATGEPLSWVATHWWQILVLVVLLEIALIWVLSPREWILIKKRDGKYYFERNKKEEGGMSWRIEAYDFWWNYNFNHGDSSSGGVDGTVGNNSGLSGRGPLPSRNLQVAIKGPQAEWQLLSQIQEPWKSFPKAWEYHLATFTKEKHLKAYQLRKLIQMLESHCPELRGEWTGVKNPISKG